MRLNVLISLIINCIFTSLSCCSFSLTHLMDSTFTCKENEMVSYKGNPYFFSPCDLLRCYWLIPDYQFNLFHENERVRTGELHEQDSRQWWRVAEMREVGRNLWVRMKIHVQHRECAGLISTIYGLLNGTMSEQCSHGYISEFQPGCCHFY